MLLAVSSPPSPPRFSSFPIGDLVFFEHYIICGVGIRKGQDIMTAVVCNIFDNNGEVAAGVASVEVIVSC